MSEEKRITKIQALLAKAESTDSEEESDALFAKAEELMVKWSIDEAVARAAGKMEAEDFVCEKVDLASTYFMADIDLMMAVANNGDCRLVMAKPASNRAGWVKVVGFKGDVERALMLFTSLRIQVTRGVGKAVQPPEDFSSSYIFRKSFRQGFAYRIGERLRKQREATVKDAAEEHGTGMELVLRNKSEVVDQKYSEMFRNLRRARSGRQGWSGAGGNQGRAAGDRADVGNSRVGGRKAIR